MKAIMKKAALGALAATAVLGVASTASAAIVCNGSGYCWHVRGPQYNYRPEFGLTVHEDNWRWGAGDHYRWREHAGRGYWRDNRWVRF